LLIATSCSGGAEDPIRVQGMVAFPPKDTVHFALPATMHHCTDRRSILLQGFDPQGNGVIARLRFRDSLTSGPYPITSLGDTITAPSANAALRYMLRDVPHEFAFDTGSAQVRRDGSSIGVRVTGSGIENAIRTPARIEFRDVPMANETVSCNYQP
jgi:hypothetical protein